MEDITELCLATEVPDGSMKSFRFQNRDILIAHIGSKWFALSDTCTHAKCSLSKEGMLQDKRVVCGCHGASFELATGIVCTPPASIPIQTYNVTVRSGKVYVSE